MNKYKISEEDGIRLLLETEETLKEEEKTLEVPVETFKLSKKKKLMLGATAFIFAVTILLTILYVKSVRSENLYVREMVSSYDDYIKRFARGANTMEEVDSLLNRTDILVENFRAAANKYSSRQELKTIYAEMIVRKHVINLEVEFATYGEVNYSALNPEDYKIVSQFNPDMLFLVDLLKEIFPFIKFYNDYPQPPEAANVAPESWKIDSLFKYGGDISNILKAHDIVLKEKFPGVYSSVQYIFNNLYPKAFSWKKFWDKYTMYVRSTNNEEKAGLLQDLQAQFPKLTIIGNNSLEGISGVNNIIIGISNTAVLPVQNTTMQNEWQPVIQFLQRNCGVQFQLQTFKSEDDLFEAYSNGTVGIALFNNILSDRLYSSQIGRPILIRSWSKKNYVNVVAVSSGKRYKDVFSLRGARASVSKNAYLSPFLSLYKNKIEPEKYFSKLSFSNASYNAIDSVAKGKSDVAFVTEEVLYYYKYANPGANIIVNFSFGTEPLTLMWCRDNISHDVIYNVQSLLRTADPTVIYSNSSFTIHPYGDWSSVDDSKIKSMFQGFNSETLSKVNKIFLMPVKVYGQINSEKLKSELVSNLSRRGYEVVDVANLKLSSDMLNKMRMVALYCEVYQRKGFNEYVFKLIKENNGQRQEIFYNRTADRNYPPSLLRLVYEVTMHVPIYMTVVKVENGVAIIRPPASVAAQAGKEVRFARVKNNGAKSSFLGEQEMQMLGKGKVISQHDKLISVRLYDSNNKLQAGDYAEIAY